MNETSPLVELGKRVQRARRAKFRTVDKARQAAQISRGAWDNVEHFRSAKPQTYDAIEAALDWPVGTVEQILAGTYEEVEVAGEVAEAIRELEGSTISSEARKVILASLQQYAREGESGEGSKGATKPA